MKLWKENIAQHPAYVYQELAPSQAFIDVTNSIPDWHESGILDFNRRRENIKTIVFDKALTDYSQWNTLTSEEKNIAVELILAPYVLRLQIVSDSEDAENWEKLVSLSEGNPSQYYTGRALVYEKMRIAVSHYVRKEVWQANDYWFNLSKAQAFFEDVHIIKDWYVASNNPKFMDFIKSQNSYSLTGFNTKSYWIQELEDELISIYEGEF